MKKSFPMILSIIVSLLLIVSLYQLSNLKRQVNDLQSSLDNQLSRLDSNISSIYTNVENYLEQEASLLSETSWEYGEADMETQSVVLHCSITPKEFSPSATTATLIHIDQEYPMKLENGSFVTTVDLPMLAETSGWKVQLHDDGILRTETLDWYLSPRSDYLPTLYADIIGSTSFKSEDGVFLYERDQIIHIDISANEPFKVQSATLLEVLDGKETRRTQIDLNPDPDQLMEETETSGATVLAPETSAVDLAHELTSYYYYDFLKDTIEIPFGSTLEIYVELVDSYNLYHRALVDRQIISDTGTLMEDDTKWSWQGMEGSIYDAEGNVLWEMNYNS